MARLVETGKVTASLSWRSPAVPALRRQRQEGLQSEFSTAQDDEILSDGREETS